MSAVETEKRRFAAMISTSLDLERDSGIDLIGFVFGRLRKLVETPMREYGCTEVVGWPMFERSPDRRWVIVRQRGVRRVLERLHLRKPVERYEQVGWVYRMTVWAR